MSTRMTPTEIAHAPLAPLAPPNTRLELLRAIYWQCADTARSVDTTVDPDLAREAGMDGNYARLLQAARDLDARWGR